MRRRTGLSRAFRWIGALVVAAAVLWFGLAPLQFGNFRMPLVDSPDKHGIQFETVLLRPTDQPITLRAWWMPATQPKAALVMVHGGGGNRSLPYTSGFDLAHFLIQHGYSIVAPDLRNHGESDASPHGSPSFGPDEAHDVIAAIDFVHDRDPSLRFGAIGYSMGGQSIIYAAVTDKRIEALVTDSTYADVRSITANFAHAVSGLPKLLFSEPFLISAEMLHGIPLSRARAIDVIGRLEPRPILIIHDAADPIVPVEHSRRLAQAYPKAELWITSMSETDLPESARSPFGTHCHAYELHPREYEATMLQFFDRVYGQQ